MQKVILFKKEAVYGTDAAPTPAANAVLTRNWNRPDPILVDVLERNLDLPTRGRTKTANTNRRTACSFEVEAAGAGAAGTVAPVMELLECCGMAAPVVTAGVRVEQKFAAEGAALSSGTQYDWLGDQRVRALGQRGTFGFDFTAGQYGFWKFDFQGMLPAVGVDNTAPAAAADFTRWKDPLEVSTANTSFLLGGHAIALKSFTGDANADVKVRNLVGANYVQRGNHAMTVRIVGEAPAIGTKNYFTNLDAGDEIAVQLIHGVGAGKIVQLDASYLQITKISRSVEDDKIMLDISAGLNIRVGSDDLLITTK